jgi:hypothetical protein
LFGGWYAAVHVIADSEVDSALDPIAAVLADFQMN